MGVDEGPPGPLWAMVRKTIVEFASSERETRRAATDFCLCQIYQHGTPSACSHGARTQRQ